jgi:hypothetical protein
MAEQRLDVAQAQALFQQMRGEGMLLIPISE